MRLALDSSSVVLAFMVLLGTDVSALPLHQDTAPPTPERSFDLAALDATRWSIDETARATIAARLDLGRRFFGAADRQAFVAALRAAGVGEDVRPEIGWIVAADGRHLGVRLSRAVREIAAMSEADFAAYRRAWTPASEREARRFRPLPGEIRGYGSDAQKAPMLATSRDLIATTGRDDFLARIAGRAENGYVSLLFVPKGGQGPAVYGLPVDQIAALDDGGFALWRRRFLRWVEIHTPGQSRVAWMAKLSDAEFEEEWAVSKDRHGGLDIPRALARLESRTGVKLVRPRFAAGQKAPVVESVAEGSAGGRATLAAGDRILQVEGAAVPDWDDFPHALDAWLPGSTVRLHVRAADAAAERKVTRFLEVR